MLIQKVFLFNFAHFILIATAAPKIYVSNSSVVGSIGVICKFGYLYEMLFNVFQKRVYLFSKPNRLGYMRPFKNWESRVG